jgi:hypothetical protein
MSCQPVTVYVTVRPFEHHHDRQGPRRARGGGSAQAKTTVPVTSNANGPVTLTVALSMVDQCRSPPTTIDADVQAQWRPFTAVVAVLVFGVSASGIYRTIAKRRRVNRATDAPTAR